jgi:hypothetical protein
MQQQGRLFVWLAIASIAAAVVGFGVCTWLVVIDVLDDSNDMIVLLAVVGGPFIGFAVSLVGWQRQRRRQVCDILKRAGFQVHYKPSANVQRVFFEQVADLNLFPGRPYGVKWVAEGRIDGVRVAAFEHYEVVGPAECMRTYIHSVWWCPELNGPQDDQTISDLPDRAGPRDRMIRWAATSDRIALVADGNVRADEALPLAQAVIEATQDLCGS